VAALAVVFAGTAYAHETQPTSVREIVRAHATEWRSFRIGDLPDTPPPPESPLTLQGAREQLRRLRDARRDQLVTILAERRPGSRDLFLLAVDLCPAD
jgi:hypothetical protein